MNIVKFPGLNIEFKFSKIAFNLFGISVYKYSICIVFGIIVALILARLSKKKFGISYEFFLETVLGCLIFGIIGARIYYVIFKLDYYIINPLKIFNIRDGGLAIYGGLISGCIYIILKCRKNRISKYNFLDYIVPYIAIAQAIGRFGNFFNIEAYGYETMSLLRMGIETNNGYIEVHPMFLYESIASLLIFIILKFKQKNRNFKGQILHLYVFFYSGIRMFLETLRTDSLMLGSLRISQIVSILLFVYSGTWLLFRYIRFAKIDLEKQLKNNSEK